MHKALRHTLFWVAYLVLDTAFVYMADSRFSSALSSFPRLMVAAEASAVLLIPKTLLTYFLMYVMMDRILKRRLQMVINIAWIAVAIAVAMVIYWALEIYFIYPLIYQTVWPHSAFLSGVSFLFAFIDLGFVSGVAISIRQVRLQLATKEKEKLLIKDKLETELKFLKSQTNPHFLFNTLNNIYALSRKNSANTADAIMKLSGILRFMLYESGQESISVRDEAKLIADYIDLEKLRYGSRLDIIFEKQVDNDEELVSPLMLLPFVENAFKHGASESRFDSFIHIELKVNKGLLQFIVENNKTEDTHKDGDNESIGLVNIRRQLELLYADYQMKVENEEHTFKVILQVNLNSYGKV